MDISNLSETELKAMFYDELTKKEQAEVNMRLINDQIAKRRQEPSEAPTVGTEPDEEESEVIERTE